MSQFIREACVETLAQVLSAKEKGADRVELCDRLDLDGTTPSRELIRSSIASGIPVRVMIRPRGGDFKYSEEELEEMIGSINLCKELGAEGVVFGIQKSDKTLNYEQIDRLVKLSFPLKVIIHKVIDETPDPISAVQKLIKINGVTGVLTSGGKNRSAFEGKKTLIHMLETSGNKLEIIPAGKITDKNIMQLHEILRAKAYHGKLIVGIL